MVTLTKQDSMIVEKLCLPKRINIVHYKSFKEKYEESKAEKQKQREKKKKEKKKERKKEWKIERVESKRFQKSVQRIRVWIIVAARNV